jgi:predicted DNA-binding transcriptional regulator AlpA
MSELLSKLDEIKAAMLAASIPFEHRWLDSEGCAALLCVSPGHFRDRIACLPDFPKGRKFTGGHRRWKASEVDAWAQHRRAA